VTPNRLKLWLAALHWPLNDGHYLPKRLLHVRAVQTYEHTDNRPTEQQELQVGMRRITGIQKVALGGITDGPVDVFAGSVNTFKWLFIKQAIQTVLFSCIS